MTAMSLRQRRLAIPALVLLAFAAVSAADTQKPVLHGKHWVAITGKPLAVTAGARTSCK